VYVTKLLLSTVRGRGCAILARVPIALHYALYSRAHRRTSHPDSVSKDSLTVNYQYYYDNYTDPQLFYRMMT
jgi:hypothetical protein